MTDDTERLDPRVNAFFEELQAQRAFLGDRATNLAGALAQAKAQIEELNNILKATKEELVEIKNLCTSQTKELEEWKNKTPDQLPLET